MDSPEFLPLKYLGLGCYSAVYLVTSARMQDRGKLYALKRFFILYPEVFLMAMNEYKILKRLVAEDNVSPFLPTLYYSMTLQQSPVLVFNRARDITLDNIITVRNPLKENQARRYIAEIICGLSYLHALNIVHMELNPKNILISQSGHILITNFDRSFDLSERRDQPQDKDFSENYYYSAPEIAWKEMISDKADVWSVGVVMADLIGKSIRDVSIGEEAEKEAQNGNWSIKRFSTLSKGLQQFLQACLTVPYVMRPSITEVTRLEFFREVNWMHVQDLQTEPPFTPSELNAIAKKVKRPHNPFKTPITNALFQSDMHILNGGAFCYVLYEKGNAAFSKGAPEIVNFNEIGCTSTIGNQRLSQFNFIHPSLSSLKTPKSRTIFDCNDKLKRSFSS
ncbi:hypothetical protein Aperf_G00000083522 [Anoplocephala perfoliata]